MVFSHSQPAEAHDDSEQNTGHKPSKQALFREPANAQAQVQAPSAH